MVTTKTIPEINERIEKGTVTVMTATEILAIAEKGERIPDVDVVTCGTKGIMSGTMASLSFKVAEKNAFIRAKGLWLNGVPAYPGPCPNERLGIVDAIVYGTAHSTYDHHYGGGHLFRDLVEGNEIEVEVDTGLAERLTTTVTLSDMGHARMIATRHAFKNYLAYVNPVAETLEKSIFSVGAFYGPYKELKFCGCGELNPIEKDPDLEVLGAGTRALINGAPGMITGAGTRSTREKPNFSAVADLKQMKSEYLGGFVTSEGPEVIASWAVPVPVLNDRVLKNILKTDKEIPLPVVDVRGRIELGRITYADVWKNCDFAVRFNPDLCDSCEPCKGELICPTAALSKESKRIDRSRCFNCGTCVGLCPAVSANMGSVEFNGMTIPITERHSDRLGAMKISNELKKQIASGEFKLSEIVQRITF
ncbi:methanogenesis marker 16 metalloprotein [Methanocella arvoryzae]|uniref:2(4Fe-4S) ferredoxin-domain protein n=1 Tax=Methanocella arvoryzae (strain DSM 22066 / NBRC 105507 / MRE50) TaxID=351160 RepID=Q0W110_METAR|nr:methanogenesis marker 16 metalloprotein [Methanocella arvoryzae]CAJ37933.1 2(4Fe-4S) ferredoxin-domain protein [Methanocella arvoryzae MRE50]